MKKTISLMLLMLFFIPQILYADTENGVTTTKTQDLGVNQKTAQIFDSYALTSTSFVYNNAGGTTTTDGWIDIAAYNDNTITFQISTWYSGTITARIEMQGGSTTVFSEIITLDYGTTTAGPVTLHPIGIAIPVSESGSKIRTGWKVSSATGSATVNTDGFFRQNR